MADMNRELWQDYTRSLALQRALYADRSDIIRSLIPGAEILLYNHRHEFELPSYCVVRSPAGVEVIINGTENSAQKFGHLRGYLGVTYGSGAANRSWWQVCPRLRDQVLPHLPARSDRLTDVIIHGHSYGAALAQILADIEADAGREMQRWRVIAIASPKPYTSGVPALRQRTDILRSTNDLVSVYPMSFAPVYQTDPILGVIPFPNQFAEWQHRGNVVSLDGAGRQVLMTDPDEYDPAEDYSFSFAAHATGAYLDRLNRYGIRSGWGGDDLFLGYKSAFNVASEGGSKSELYQSLGWIPGSDVDPIWRWVFSGVFRSKGRVDGMYPIACKAHFEAMGYGFSEEYIYYPNESGSRNFASAEAAFDKLTAKRLALYPAVVRVGPHLKLLATSYRMLGGPGQGWTDWTRNEAQPDETGAKNFNGEVEAPFVGYLYRLYSSYGSSRTLLFRPIPAVGFATVDNTKVVDHTGVMEPINQFLKWIKSQNCWAIQALDKSAEAKRILSVHTVGLVDGNALLKVPGHGFVQGDEIQVHGGRKEDKPLRGRHVVGDLTTTNEIHIISSRTLTHGLSKALCRKVVYHYPLISSHQVVKLSKRDTGRPIALGRGRR